jgi:hypothetical protein
MVKVTYNPWFTAPIRYVHSPTGPVSTASRPATSSVTAIGSGRSGKRSHSAFFSACELRVTALLSGWNRRVIIQGRVNLVLPGTCGNSVDPRISVMEKTFETNNQHKFQVLVSHFLLLIVPCFVRQIYMSVETTLENTKQSYHRFQLVTSCCIPVFLRSTTVNPTFFDNQLLEPPPPPTTERLQSLGTTTTERLILSAKNTWINNYIMDSLLKILNIEIEKCSLLSSCQWFTFLSCWFFVVSHLWPSPNGNGARQNARQWLLRYLPWTIKLGELECCYACLKHWNGGFYTFCLHIFTMKISWRSLVSIGSIVFTSLVKGKLYSESVKIRELNGIDT